MPSPPSRKDTGRVLETQPNSGGELPFWRTKTLDEMTPDEWERLCDRCGRCCLVKLEDEDTGEIHMTDIACKLFDAGRCACASYAKRQTKVADCVKLTPDAVRTIRWLPRTCAYRLVNEGKPLPSWHPLRSGSADSVHAAGRSVKGRVGGSERTVRLRDYVDHIVDWKDG
jgi:uncharacterized protein